MTRDELIEYILSSIPNNKNILLEWATGVGKTRCALELMKKISYEIPKGEYFKVLLLVNEIAHKDNWYKEFVKWDLGYYWRHVEIDCYASLKKHNNKIFDLTILDECHHISTEIRIDYLESIKSDYIIGLSATVDIETKLILNRLFGKFYINQIPLKTAIEWGFIPKPKVILAPLTMDNRIQDHIIIQERGAKEKRVLIKCNYSERWKYLKNKKLYPDLTLEMKCTEYQEYLHLCGLIDFQKKILAKNPTEFNRQRWLQMAGLRKKYMGELKTKYVKQLISKLQDKRYICFCSSINQADQLNKVNSIHSKKEDSLNIIDKFNNKQINSLFAINMLQEGVNLTDIELGIIVQLGGQERELLQKLGRTLRSDNPIQIIFYYKHTRDEDYLKNVYEELDKESILEMNLEEIEL